jgi:hypothetical protein
VQFVQTDAPKLENVPGEQIEQFSEAIRLEKEPERHAVQVDCAT